MIKFIQPLSARAIAVLAPCALTVVSLGLAGCGGGPVKEETIQVQKISAIEEAKQILQNYANGAPLTSEAASFPDLITRVKAEDAAKGAELEKGLSQIQAQPNNRASIAKSLISKL
jgi:hypothetical protein